MTIAHRFRALRGAAPAALEDRRAGSAGGVSRPAAGTGEPAHVPAFRPRAPLR
jgi:hypothetical protein